MNTKPVTQFEMIERINRLMAENPGVNVRVFMFNEDIDYRHNWTLHEIKDVQLNWWYPEKKMVFESIPEFVEYYNDEYIFMKDDIEWDEQELADELGYIEPDEEQEEEPKLSAVEAEKKLERSISVYTFKTDWEEAE